MRWMWRLGLWFTLWASMGIAHELIERAGVLGITTALTVLQAVYLWAMWPRKELAP